MANVSSAIDLKVAYSSGAITARLKRLKSQIADLQGACVYVIGAGEIPHSGALSDPVELSIYRFWTNYFKLAHGKLKSWSSSVDWPLTCAPPPHDGS
jgi:hypothetical protein